MMNYRELLEWGQALLREKDIADAGIDAWYLLSYAYGLDRVHYLMDRNEIPEDEKGPTEETLYRRLIRRRGMGEPVQYLTGEADFMGLTFKVSPAVLIPRQDTELLAEKALDYLAAFKREHGRPADVLDMCTGSGCIILSLAKLGPVGRCAGADISQPALAVAAENRERLALSDQVALLSSDLFKVFQTPESFPGKASADGDFPDRPSEETASKLPEETASRLYGETASEPSEADGPYGVLSFPRTFDLIVSNPPYIASKVIPTLMREVRDHEPVLALDGSEDGLAIYRRIALEAPACLNAGGQLMLEIGYDQGESVPAILAAQGFTDIRVLKDLSGNDRVVTAGRPHR